MKTRHDHSKAPCRFRHYTEALQDLTEPSGSTPRTRRWELAPPQQASSMPPANGSITEPIEAAIVQMHHPTPLQVGHDHVLAREHLDDRTKL